MILSPYSRQEKESSVLSNYEGDILWEKIRKTYTEEFKHQAVQMYLRGEIGGGYRAVAEELGIERTILFRWIHTSQKEGREGLKEKRRNSMIEVYIGT